MPFTFNNRSFEFPGIVLGNAESWTVTVQGSNFEIANFGASQASALEGFEDGWIVGYLFAFADENLEFRIFAGPELAETFEGGWSNSAFSFGLGATEEGLFDGATEAFEDFENSWDNDTFSFVHSALTAALFDTNFNFESFDTGWDNATFSFTLTSTSAALFDGGSNAFENFEGTWTTMSSFP